ncbi:hypothetical protein Rhopal_000561-T1 [Rhodotorula paludigena]|uniref:Uncharacterized protein n=1 Tax=Rhodotorula paludigena TaxID=86838 RepID=A0AAV5G550_9BASI|nr:hypothetical protein Rhopal_000561-T1 [Rhodotorula paludigena]
MLRSSANRALRSVALTRPRPYPLAVELIAAHRSFAHSAPQRSDSPLPWFVDPATAPSAPSSAARDSAPLATAPVPTPPPAHLPLPLHPLHAYLSTSPFLDKHSLVYIHAREADPEGSWCDWVVVASLKEGRERGIRGAVEGVRRHLASHPIEFASLATDPSSPLDLPFAPPSTHPSVHGLPPAPSKHARSRASRSASRSSSAAPSRTDAATGWALLDAGPLVVHVFTPEARMTYGAEIERLWDAVGEEVSGEEGWRASWRRGEDELRDRELRENEEAVRRELEREAKEAR